MERNTEQEWLLLNRYGCPCAEPFPDYAAASDYLHRTVPNTDHPSYRIISRERHAPIK